MPSKVAYVLALDVGNKRVGVAGGEEQLRIAVPLMTIDVDGHEFATLAALLAEKKPRCIVVGYPRNLSGETTAQTELVEQFARRLEQFGLPIVFQDETLTSVQAEQRLGDMTARHKKAAIDQEAAAIILQDYFESH